MIPVEALPRSAFAERWPGLTTQVDRAVGALATILPACRHVLAAGAPPQAQLMPYAIVCAVCRDRLCCRDCHNAHIDATAAHTHQVEHTCDQCGRVVEWITSVSTLFSTAIRAVRVRGLDGRKRQVAVPIAVAGLGLCRYCRKGSA
jgi:hypothetical protein